MYKLTTNNMVIKTTESGTAFIPMIEENADYQTYLKWLDGYELSGHEWIKTSEGNTPEPAEEQA
jgi:hypothetical protein